MEKIQDDVSSSTFNPNAHDISLSSIVLQGYPSRLDSPEEDSTAESTENAPAARRKAKSASFVFNADDRPAVHITGQTSAKGILHSENAKAKSAKGRVTFRVEEKQKSSVGQEYWQSSETPRRSSDPPRRTFELPRRSTEPPRRSSEPARVSSAIDEKGERIVDEKHAEDTVGVGVYMMVDRLRPGQCFVSVT